MPENHRSPAIWGATQQEVTQDVLGRLLQPNARYWSAVLVLGGLFLLGLVGFFLRLGGGLEHRVQWGYYAATYVFLLSTAQGAPIVAIALRLMRSHWRRPLVRCAELFTVAGVLTFPMFLPLLAVLPPLEGRLNLWFEWPMAPWLWDGLAVLFLTVCGLGLLYASALPDLAAGQAYVGERRRPLLAALSSQWRGSARQWNVVYRALGILGALYLMFYVFVHMLISTDLSMSLVPGWRSAVYPAFHALSSLQAGLATTLATMALLRWVGGLRQYLALDQFWGLAKLLLALSLLWFYFWWAEFLTFWYGRTPAEQSSLTLLMFGPYLLPFILSWVLNFLVPFLSLIWNPIRVSILGPSLVSISILLGNFFDRVRLYVGPFSVEEVTEHVLKHVPAAHLPDVADVLLMVGMPAGALLLYLLAAKVVPVVSLWEVKEGLLLRRARPFLRTKVAVIAKSE